MAASARLPRLLRIIDVLQSGRVHNSNDLAQLSNVSRRTIFRDIAALQKAGLQVVFDDERQGYYLPHRLTFPPTQLTVKEALSLLLICQELGGTDDGVPFHAAARSAAWKVCLKLPQHIRDFLSEAAGAVSMHLDAHNPLSDSELHYEAVMNALIEHRQVRIDYDAASEVGVQTTLLEPYRLLFRRRSWYVVGRSSIHQEVRVFNLGRILKAEMLDQPYEVPPRFSLDRFFGNAWNLIRDPAGSCQVVVRFAPKVARNVAEVRWHKSQQTALLDDGSLEFRVTVDGIDEIAWWILGYGDQAEVLEPEALREKIRAHVENMARQYAPARTQSVADHSFSSDGASSQA